MAADPADYSGTHLPPDPAGTIRALASLGYTPQAALADLIDNSITAHATEVALTFHWAGSEGSWVAVRDNGDGMSRADLRTGMTLGSPVGERDRGSLGRFGMGLKTSSFSQARQFTVDTTDAAGTRSQACWDIDHIEQTNSWRLLEPLPAEVQAGLAQAGAGSATGERGTTVLWRRLRHLVPDGSEPSDQWSQRQFHAILRRVEQHLSMVFARYLTRRDPAPFAITLNGQALRPWDPFLGANRHTARLAPEHPQPGVSVQGFVLPHPSRFTRPDGRTLDPQAHEQAGGPNGWVDQQGFYVYREHRLIVAGGWLDLGLQKDERHQLARLAVHLSTEHDEEWAIDVRKSSAAPPAALRSVLLRHAQATRRQAAVVLGQRARPVRTGQAAGVSRDATWQVTSDRGRTGFRLNREHPLLQTALAHGADAAAVRALLLLIEKNLPLGVIRGLADDPENDGDVRAAPANGKPVPDDVLDMARQVMRALVANGSNPAAARARLLPMAPFDQYPGLDAHLDPGHGQPPERTTP